MGVKPIDLSTLHDQPEEVRAAVAFYTNYSIIPMSCTKEERERHYSVLEEAGYIEKVGV